MPVIAGSVCMNVVIQTATCSEMESHKKGRVHVLLCFRKL